MAHASLCSYQSPPGECFLIISQIHDHLIVAWKHTEGFINIVKRCLAVYREISSTHGVRQAWWICSPSINSFIFSTRPWTTLRVSAPVCQTSCCVNLSSLWTIASIFFSPRSFPTSFSFIHKSGDIFPHGRWTDALNFPRSISLVANASVESNSMRILTIISFMSPVRVIPVYILRRLRNWPKDSSKLARAL